MNKEEASEKYNIPTDILDEYEGWGLCQEVKKVMGVWQYDDVDLKRLSTIMTLHDVGFTNKEVEKYMRMMLDDQPSDEVLLKMLNKKRNSALDEIHFKERQLDRLDYLRHKIQKNEMKK